MGQETFIADLAAAPSTAALVEPPELTILMPCLDEARTVGGCIRRAQAFLREHGVRGEVLVADNQSSDGSREVAAEHGARVVVVEEKGYGAALAGGIRAARGRYVIMGDSDGSYDFEHLMPYLDRLRAGSQLVMGNRFAGGIAAGAMKPLHRYLGNPFLTAVGRCFFRSGCGDFYCGQRGFEREAVLALDLRSTGMEFALEMLVKATLLGMNVVEVPCRLAPDGRGRPPHLDTWRDGWRSLRFLLLYSPRWLFLHPGLFLIAAGTTLGLLILPSTRVVGGVNLDVHTLLYCAVAVSVGFQLAVFYVFAKVLAVNTGFHPTNERIELLMEKSSLEIGLVAGGILLSLGLLGSVLATVDWARRSFGDLDPSQGMRLVIPSALLITLGGQVLCSSFFLSLLQLQWRKLRQRAEPRASRSEG